jgi:hypothetical protein
MPKKYRYNIDIIRIRKNLKFIILSVYSVTEQLNDETYQMCDKNGEIVDKFCFLILSPSEGVLSIEYAGGDRRKIHSAEC